MKKILTVILVTFCIVIFMGPHGGGIPVILVAVILLLTFLKTFDIGLINTFFCSLLIVIGFIGTFLVRRRIDHSNAMLLALVTILILNAGLGWVILDMSEEVRATPIYSAIPFWTATTFAVLTISKRILVSKPYFQNRNS